MKQCFPGFWVCAVQTFGCKCCDHTDTLCCIDVRFGKLQACLSPALSPNRTNMANRGPAYGLSREVQSKIDKKYDPELEERLVEWIVAQCGPGVGRPEPDKSGFQMWLKDGRVSVWSA